jgi:uncharacterized protein (DUF433 family)
MTAPMSAGIRCDPKSSRMSREQSRREPRTRPRRAAILVSAMRRGHPGTKPTTVLVLSNNRSMQEAITRDPEVMHGTPVFRGTFVPVQTLFDYIENGDSLDEFLEGFPTISRELAVQVLEECAELRLARV